MKERWKHHLHETARGAKIDGVTALARRQRTRAEVRKQAQAVQQAQAHRATRPQSGSEARAMPVNVQCGKTEKRDEGQGPARRSVTPAANHGWGCRRWLARCRRQPQAIPLLWYASRCERCATIASLVFSVAANRLGCWSSPSSPLEPLHPPSH